MNNDNFEIKGMKAYLVFLICILIALLADNL
jgi:hypothetical protein